MDSKKVYLVTGGAGSIGSELVRQLAPGNRVVVWDIDETRMFDLVEELRNAGHDIDGYVVDVRDRDALTHCNPEFRPTVIFHCAARKHVTPMEDTPLEAVSVNIHGTENMIRFTERHNSFLVNISTDKVVNANCVMGATKKVAEIMVRNSGYVSVRFGNVMGSRGSVLPIWQKQLDQNKPLTVTDERMTRFMMTIPDACKLLIKASEVGESGDILIMDMGEKVNLLQLAKDLLNKSGKDVGIKMIGIRPGETLTEELMTEHEQLTAKKDGQFWIIKK
jgi:FlaA1/EpsC-like NDP-sugar epimerase